MPIQLCSGCKTILQTATNSFVKVLLPAEGDSILSLMVRMFLTILYHGGNALIEKVNFKAGGTININAINAAENAPDRLNNLISGRNHCLNNCALIIIFKLPRESS